MCVLWCRLAAVGVTGRVRGSGAHCTHSSLSTRGAAGGRGGVCYGVWLGVSVDLK